MILMSARRLKAVQLYKDNVNSLDIILFFESALVTSGLVDSMDSISVVLDNATMHRTNAILKFFNTNNIHLLYTVKRHSLFNPVEYAIRYIKKEFRPNYTAK